MENKKNHEAQSDMPVNRPGRRINLPVIDNIQSRVREVIRSAEHANYLARVNAFLRSKFPLSKKGEAVLSSLLEAIDQKDENSVIEIAKTLPTVENPNMELFAHLDISPDEDEDIFSWNLANIQITKGCSHKCTFCALDSSKTKGIQYMPFTAILRIAERKKHYEDTYEQLWERFKDLCESEKDIREDHLVIPLDKFPFYAIKDGIYYQIPEDAKDLVFFDDFMGSKAITNYYNNEPFDYRDTSFVHEDGTPADYGDVVMALDSKKRPIRITTAGWVLTDKIAQRAAEKVVKAGVEHLRISVSSYERNAIKDPKKYRKQMENVIATLSPLKPKVMFFCDETDESASVFKAL